LRFGELARSQREYSERGVAAASTRYTGLIATARPLLRRMWITGTPEADAAWG